MGNLQRGERWGLTCLWPHTRGGGGAQGQTGLPPQLGSGCPWVPPPASSSDGSVGSRPEPCSKPGERCFLRQPWLQPLQLEQLGLGGGWDEGNGRRGAGDWPWRTPSPLSRLSSSKVHAKALKLGWRSMVQPPGPGGNSLLWLWLEGVSEKFRGAGVGWVGRGSFPEPQRAPRD